MVSPLALGFLVTACASKAPPTFDGDAGDGRDAAANNEPILGDPDGGTSAPCVPGPANVEIPENGCDDDGDGTIDNPKGCDTGLPVSGDAMAFARSLGLCQTATGASDTKWGVISATYSNGFNRTTAPNGAQHGIHPKFGNVIKPREGTSLGVLSTGYAREFNSANDRTKTFKTTDIFDAEPMQTSDGITGRPGAVPPGFPKRAQGCQVDTNVFDTINVKLQIKVPANAKGFSFDFNFWSGEWPEYVCTKYNDGFIAYLKSEAFNNGAADNMSFDAQNNPVSVNNGFFDRCTANTRTGCATDAEGVVKTATCPGGTGELQGTGFGSPEGSFCTGASRSSPGGATGWLTSTAPVKGGEVITLELIIWDTGDANFDSSVLLDNFKWVPGDVRVVTERPK